MQEEWQERSEWQRSAGFYLTVVGYVAVALVQLVLVAPRLSGWYRAVVVVMAVLWLLSGWRLLRMQPPT